MRQFLSIFRNWWLQFLFLADWMWGEPTQTWGRAAGDVRAAEHGEKTETLPDWHIRFCRARQESGAGGLSPPPSPICCFICIFKAGPAFDDQQRGGFPSVRNKTGPHSKNMQSDAMWCSAAVKRHSYGVFGVEFSVEHTQHGRLRMCCSGEVSRMDNLWNHTSLYETLQTLPRLVSDYLLALETAASNV